MPTILSTWKEPGKVAIHGALARIAEGGSLLDALEAGLTAAEADESLVAIGRGAVPNADGEIELDAAIMEGAHLNAGAVCALRGILPAISVARAVMERTTHVMLAADQARRFALSQGFLAQNLLSADSIKRWKAWLREPIDEDDYIHTVQDKPVPDTVTMLGREGEHFVAASSTSGLSFKLPGRVGDSPILGAGIYADDEVGCAGATGWGEELWKACASFRTVRNMAAGATALEACRETVRHMIRRQEGAKRLPCVVLALDRDGGWGAAVTKGHFDLWVSVEGRAEVHGFDAPEP